MNSGTNNQSQNQPLRSQIICKGTKKGTTLPCNEVLCETDGANLFVKLPSGKELAIKPNKRGFGLVCPSCEFKTFWIYGMHGEMLEK